MIYLLRVGPFGQIGRFRSEFDFSLVHGQKVICRTPRGLEVGEFLETDKSSKTTVPVDGDLIRTPTSQDEMLLDRLNRNRLEAIEACQKLIEQSGLPVAVLDAELTFDGKELFFYFTGETGPELDAITESLAKAYDAKVRFSEFAELLATGCGPDCGTSASNGCQDSGCSSCGLKSACKSD